MWYSSTAFSCRGGGGWWVGEGLVVGVEGWSGGEGARCSVVALLDLRRRNVAHPSGQAGQRGGRAGTAQATRACAATRAGGTHTAKSSGGIHSAQANGHSGRHEQRLTRHAISGMSGRDRITSRSDDCKGAVIGLLTNDWAVLVMGRDPWGLEGWSGLSLLVWPNTGGQSCNFVGGSCGQQHGL